MFEIQGKQFFGWPKQMGTIANSKDKTLHYSYLKDHEHGNEDYKTLNQFLERLVEQGHLAKYVKPGGKKPDQPKLVNDEVSIVKANRPVARVIEAIHGIVDISTATRSYLWARLTRAQLWSPAHPIVEIMSVLVPKRDRESNLMYELSFTEEDLEGDDTPHNDALVMMVNICKYDVKRVLIDPGISFKVM